MKDIRFTGEPRDGEEEFKQIDLRTYAKRVFSMYGGEQRLVQIRFINPLLDAVVDRFGTKDVIYREENIRFLTSGALKLARLL